ncbi:MAG: c-type cytochrome OmcS [Coriobacteriia bacterium]
MSKRLGLIIALALAITVVSGGIAFANFGPHGGYQKDTDACAGCHRAHTSFATVGWTDRFGVSHTSALLVSSASTQEEFCLACHGDYAPGASTNVESGVFDAGPSAASTHTPYNNVTDTAGTTAYMIYQTDSTFEATLNGGGFVRMPNGSVTTTYGGASYTAVTSVHNTDDFGATDPMWGVGQAADNNYGVNLQCGSCHDPHGSSNYRLLKDSVNGNTVGGYDSNDVPSPFVSSREIGYPWNGWLKHGPGHAQIATYQPNYTEPAYGYMPNSGTQMRSMSGWCAACHESYIQRASTYDYSVENTAGTSIYFNTGDGRQLGEWYDANGNSAYDAGEPTVGDRMRYRHPVNVSINAIWLNATTVTDTLIPLEMTYGSLGSIDRYSWDRSGIISCLTCHRAHGTSATMTGWAEASYVSSPTATVTWYPEIDPGSGGVNPNKTSALLRRPNRGVCERCHNK